MENKSIGLLEEMLLLVVINREEATGSKVLQFYNETFKRSISLPAVISILKRLEKKGFLKTKMGTPHSGVGKKRKLYTATPGGFEVAFEIQKSREELWKGLRFSGEIN